MFIFILFFSPLHPWSATGHRIVAAIAQSHLHQKTIKALTPLLEGQSLAQTSNWADEIKSDPLWDHARSWHYVNMSKEKDYFKMKHHKKGDLLRALYYFEGRLQDETLSKIQRKQALKFLIHFVGDLHQPLHVGYKKDRGGNKTKVSWFGEKTNLHVLWDYHMIEHSKLSYTEYTRFINRFSSREKSNWKQGNYLDWAYESRDKRDALYHVGRSASYRYIYRHKSLLNEQLKKAGWRLACVLNRIVLKTPLNKKDTLVRNKFNSINTSFGKKKKSSR